MRVTSEIWERVRGLVHRAREETEMEEELRFHMEMQTEANIRAGMNPEEARRHARIAFGSVERHKEEVREARGLGWAEIVARDVAYAFRGLRLHPVFSGALVFTLALGIGTAIAMFSIVDALLLRPLPYHAPGRLVGIERVLPSGTVVPYLGWEDAQGWGEESGLFESAMTHTRRSLLYTGGGEPMQVPVEAVTHDFDVVLGVRPALGRGFYREDAEPGASRVIILEHTFWSEAFGARASAVGEFVQLDGSEYRIVGVMPEHFRFPMHGATRAWVPIRTDGTIDGGAAGLLQVVGRLRGESLDVAQSRADAIAVSLAEAEPREQGHAIQLSRLSEQRARGLGLREAIWFLSGAVLLLLLVSAVNATSLLLVRGWARGRELTVRAVLGASRRRVLAQLLTESMVLAVVSGIIAWPLALLGLRVIRGVMPDTITFFSPYEIGLEWRALAFALLLIVILGTAVGALPALRILRSRGASAGTSLTRYAADNPFRSRLRRGLIVAEVSLSVLLLIGAGLLIRSFANLAMVDPGFRVDDVAVLTLNLSPRYPSAEAKSQFVADLRQRLEVIPGVEGVAVNARAPAGAGFMFGVRLEAEGVEPLETGQPNLLPHAAVPLEFFDVLEVQIVRGRAFTAEDQGTDHVIIDRALSAFLWGDADPVGRRFRTSPEAPWLTVIGLTPELRMMGPDDRNFRYAILYPMGRDYIPDYLPIAIRTRGDPRGMLQSFRLAVRGLDPLLPIEELRPARELYAASIDMPRFLLVLMSILAGLALVLTAVGIYGVLAFAVAQRRRELGIRIALGAPLSRVSWGVLREGLVLAATGAVIGTAAALAVSRIIEGVLYGVQSTDPITIATVVLVSLLAASVACYGPARRAIRVDPVESLRTE